MKDLYPKVYLYKRIVQAKLYIEDHLAEKIDLENIADEAHFSKFHFIRLFRSVYGKTPHQYLTMVRIEKAKILLQKDFAVTEVCFAVGYDSLTSFTGLFKRLTRQTPSGYQFHHRQRQQQIKERPLQFIPNCFAEQKGWVKK
jgi:AraC-like DNA-binding protein